MNAYLNTITDLGGLDAWDRVSAIPQSIRTSREIRGLYSTADIAKLAAWIGREPTADEIKAYNDGYAAALDEAFDDAVRRER